MGMYNKSQFVFSETFNNKDGKTSGSGFIGIILGLTAAACFIAAMVGWFLQKPDVLEIMGKIIILSSISAGLLGLRKFVGSKDSISIGEEPITPTPSTTSKTIINSDEIVDMTNKG